MSLVRDLKEIVFFPSIFSSKENSARRAHVQCVDFTVKCNIKVLFAAKGEVK